MPWRIAVEADSHDSNERIQAPPAPSDTTPGSPRVSQKYAVELRTLALNRATVTDAARTHNVNTDQLDPSSLYPPALDLRQLHHERAMTLVRRKSTHVRRLDEAEDSTRLESTRRRISTVPKEPSRASVVYSPRALTILATERRPPSQTRKWSYVCTVQ